MNGVRCGAAQCDGTALRIDIACGLLVEGDAEIIAFIAEFLRRREPVDAVPQEAGVLFQLLEPDIGGLDVDVLLFEIFKDIVIPLPVMVHFIDVFLIFGIPVRKDFLLLLELIFPCFAHDRLVGLPLVRKIGDAGDEQQCETEASENLSVRDIVVKKRQQREAQQSQQINEHNEFSLKFCISCILS